MGCCMPGGYLSPDKQKLLQMVAAEGVELPEQVQVWTGQDGRGWRLVDYSGRELGVRGRRSVRDTVQQKWDSFIISNEGWNFQ